MHFHFRASSVNGESKVHSVKWMMMEWNRGSLDRIGQSQSDVHLNSDNSVKIILFFTIEIRLCPNSDTSLD